MNWKTELQLQDIVGQRLEAQCRLCGHVRVIDLPALLRQDELKYLHLDELERMEVCHARGCRGGVRIALVSGHATRGFPGGLT